MTYPNNHVSCLLGPVGEMRLKRHFCLIAVVALVVGCGELDFDPQLSQAEEPPAYTSRQAPTAVSSQAKPESVAAENLSGTPEAPLTQIVTPAPAPVTPNSNQSTKGSIENPSIPEPVALPEIPRPHRLTRSLRRPKRTHSSLLAMIPKKTLRCSTWRSNVGSRKRAFCLSVWSSW